ncbi:hypothetical protein [Shewanella litorisediminis]|uniref:Uncharacterized protein n=1 Tax=Shewanella litorisediminis TaxID=1173586 RepID=A0ABX7G418_9GAMM|nr:hypothetical protein [Shewanella litorisediminis]MCL2919387.1 hypothetical protein [Shewanella litorisediminis]QRH01998.1 hypothetical protein JQC75_00695 [Shewanella litorisediminis]
MKRFMLLSLLTLTSMSVVSNDDFHIPGVLYSSSDSSTLAIHNLSKEEITIDIYGENFTLANGSGLSFDCESQSYVEIQIKNKIHDYFEVSCPSKVTFSDKFKLVD